MRIFRIVKGKYAAQAFNGIRSLDCSGRWHLPGQPAVYTAGSLSLSLLETLVHCEYPRVLGGFVWFALDLPDDLIETPAELPDGWDKRPYTISSTFGGKWFEERRSVGLKVPSVIVPEPNVVINPTHPAFDPKKVEGPFDLGWDERLK